MRDPNSDDEVTGVSVSEDTVNNALRRVAANRQARRKAKPASSGNTETSSMRVDAMAAAYGAECSAALDGMDDDLQETSKHSSQLGANTLSFCNADRLGVFLTVQEMEDSMEEALARLHMLECV